MKETPKSRAFAVFLFALLLALGLPRVRGASSYQTRQAAVAYDLDDAGNLSGRKTEMSAIVVVDDANNLRMVPGTAEGHPEVAIHAPRLPFGSVHTEKLTPIFQVDGVYGINPFLANTTSGLSVGTGSGSGSASASGNLMTVSTGTTQYSFGTIQSRRRLRYRPGQGVVLRYAGFFSEPAANSILVAGCGTAESGYFFGYNGTNFGILFSTGGVREIHTLTVSTASTATNSYVVTLPNTDTATVVATANSSTSFTAYEISKGTYPGWNATSIGSTVVFVASSVGSKTGTFALAQTGAGTPAAGSAAETVSGSAATDTWISQADWNKDVMDGSGGDDNPSGYTLDPQYGNVYQIDIQYLGFGAVSFSIEAAASGNNPNFVTVHTIRFPGTRTAPTQSQPSFPFTMAAYSAGSTTDVSVSVSSFAGFNEGEVKNLGPRLSYYKTAGVTSSTSEFIPLFTVKNKLVHQNRPNQSVSHLLSVSGAAKSNQGLTTFYLIRNASLAGGANFVDFDDGVSTTVWDNTATACTFSGNSQMVWSETVSEAGQLPGNLSDSEITLQPGESITLAVRSVTATAVCLGSLNTREDQ